MELALNQETSLGEIVTTIYRVCILLDFELTCSTARRVALGISYSEKDIITQKLKLTFRIIELNKFMPREKMQYNQQTLVGKEISHYPLF